MRKILVAAVLFTAITSEVQAEDIGLNVGMIEVLGVPKAGHLGLYPYAALSIISATKEEILIPAVGVEWSPESDRWGFVCTFTVDFPITDKLGFDLNTALIHDQSGTDWDNALFFLGVGPGVSATFGHWVVSPYFEIFGQIRPPDPSFALVPGINLAYIP